MLTGKPHDADRMAGGVQAHMCEHMVTSKADTASLGQSCSSGRGSQNATWLEKEVICKDNLSSDVTWPVLTTCSREGDSL